MRRIIIRINRKVQKPIIKVAPFNVIFSPKVIMRHHFIVKVEALPKNLKWNKINFLKLRQISIEVKENFEIEKIIPYSKNIFYRVWLIFAERLILYDKAANTVIVGVGWLLQREWERQVDGGVERTSGKLTRLTDTIYTDGIQGSQRLQWSNGGH